MNNAKEPSTRICMVVFSYYPRDPRVRREVEALVKANIGVDIVCLRGKEERRAKEYGKVDVYRVMKGTDKKEAILKYVWLTTLFGILATMKLWFLAIKKKYGAIQIHNMPDYLVFVALIQKILRKPVILDLHDLSVELFKSRWLGRISAYLLPLVKWVEKLSCRFADEIITTSSGFKDKLLERGVQDNKVTLVLNSADQSIFRYQGNRIFRIMKKDVRLLYHGTVAERFGLYTAVKAVSIIRERFPGARLTIYGKYDPTYFEMLKQAIERLNLADCVFLEGWRSLEEIYTIILQSDIALVPYLCDDFMNLALSTKTFEYVAAGVPVVASRLQSIEAIFHEEDIHYCIPGDESDMAHKIEDLCMDPVLCRKLTGNAYRTLHGISGNVMGKRYTDLIRRVLKVR